MDLTVTASGVVTPNVNAPVGRGTVFAGETISQGQSVYADPNNSYQIRRAQANAATPAANTVGVALNAASGGQPITYAAPGADVTLPTSGTNTTMVQGQVYVVSAGNPGGIAPVSDLVTGNYVSVLGVATTGTNLHLGLIPTATQK